MLVSTHNLGSVTTFCDYTVMVKGTVLASGPTAPLLQPGSTGELTLAAYCAMSLNGSEESIITDDERPGTSTVSGAEGRKMNALLEPFSYEYMLNAMWSRGDGRRSLPFLSCYLMLKKAGR